MKVYRPWGSHYAARLAHSPCSLTFRPMLKPHGAVKIVSPVDMMLVLMLLLLLMLILMLMLASISASAALSTQTDSEVLARFLASISASATLPTQTDSEVLARFVLSCFGAFASYRGAGVADAVIEILMLILMLVPTRS